MNDREGAPLLIRWLGRRDYQPVFQAMQARTRARTDASADEFWIVEHASVFTQGQAGRAEHLLQPGEIPVVQVDRGGQVTWHGPGQIVIYPLLDLRRGGWGVRQVVTAIETAVVTVLADHGITGQPRADAPGVYVDGAKIAALGLRVSRGRTTHGLSFNLDCTLEPFSRINPCGMAGLPVTRLTDLGVTAGFDEIARELLEALLIRLGLARRPRRTLAELPSAESDAPAQ